MGGDIKMRIKKAFVHGRSDEFAHNGKRVELRYPKVKVAGQKHSLYVNDEFVGYVDSPTATERMINDRV